MTHGVSFIDEHRHDSRGGRSAAPIACRTAGAPRVGAPGAVHPLGRAA